MPKCLWVMVMLLAAIGCQEHEVRRTQFAPSTPFGSASSPAMRNAPSAAKSASNRPQMSTDWRGTPKLNSAAAGTTGGSGSRPIGQPLVPSGSAVTR